MENFNPVQGNQHISLAGPSTGGGGNQQPVTMATHQTAVVSQRQLDLHRNLQAGQGLANLLIGRNVSSRDGLHAWMRAVSQTWPPDANNLGRHTGEIYRFAAVTPNLNQKCSIERYIGTLQALYVNGPAVGVSVRAQSEDNAPVKHSPAALYATDPNKTSEDTFRFMKHPRPQWDADSRARLIVNPHPKYAITAIRALAAVTATHPDVGSSKIAGHDWLGRRPDDGIIYLKSQSEARAQNVKDAFLAEVRNLLGEVPADFFADQSPAGTKTLGTGFHYAECAPGRDTSYGNDRGEIIGESLKIAHAEHADPDIQLDYEAFKRGYDPFNPYRVMSQSEQKGMTSFMALLRQTSQQPQEQEQHIISGNGTMASTDTQALLLNRASPPRRSNLGERIQSEARRIRQAAQVDHLIPAEQRDGMDDVAVLKYAIDNGVEGAEDTINALLDQVYNEGVYEALLAQLYP